MVSDVSSHLATDVNARIAESDRVLQRIRGQISAQIPLVAWPALWHIALLRALRPALHEPLNPAEWRKIEAARFWVRLNERAYSAVGDEAALSTEDAMTLVYLVDRLRADLASGWDRPHRVF